MPAKRPLKNRFWEKVDKRGPQGPYVDTPCWVWTACVNRRGYGQIGVRTSRPVAAHRVSWELHHGPIPTGQHVLHRCHNPGCVRPDHLYLGSYTDNAKDRVIAGRVNPVQGASHPNAILTETDVLAILHARQNGATARQLARQYGIAVTTVADICSGRSWTHVDRSQFDSARLKPRALRGERHPNHKITSAMKQTILAMRSQGLTYRAIADVVGCSSTAVYYTVRRAEESARQLVAAD